MSKVHLAGIGLACAETLQSSLQAFRILREAYADV